MVLLYSCKSNKKQGNAKGMFAFILPCKLFNLSLWTENMAMNNSLNLPPYDVRIGGTQQHPTIFDVLRRRHVALTPEEWVRQHFVHYLIEHRGYPPTLLANEVKLQLGDKQLRADTVVYDRQLQPRMIVEYKAPHIALTQRVLEQASAYNLLLHVDFLIVSNGLNHYCCRIDYANNSYQFLPDIPHYNNVIQSL